ncbi:O-antigen ligase family protein [Anaerocolumna sp. MB42-C2]|uniref:O-antigen ligase family protein n=1 Tax=Anaerocolumna sp. MB42-C2 TaxID=3070997 RepID=UPI0027E1104D|nr:O-antigen ligase family protein [Anaerocolumna sp. MB42-C2]WMJ86107.1 O-antigen ligase family protein [Anaerocolumna sp. MB42-C2]
MSKVNNTHYVLTIYSLLKRGIIIEKKAAIRRQIDDSLTYTNIIILTVISIFLPYIFAGIILVGLGIYLVINKQTRKIIFAQKYSKYIFWFFVFYLIEALLYGNWFGVGAGFGLILAVFIGLFQRSFMTRELYERVLTLVCLLSVTSSSCAISQKYVISLLDDFYSYNRISAMFLHPNYFGTITATVIIVCAYKIFTNQGPKWLYYIIGILNVVSIYLCESMFAWIEVFVGISVLLIVLKKWRIFWVWVFAAILAVFIIFALNIDLIPRLSDAGETIRLRLKIWNFVVEEIKKSPLLGHGSMSCAFLSSKSDNLIPHSHSIYLDSLLNYGIIGAIIMLVCFAKYLYSVLSICFKEKQTTVTSLILAISAAALVHGITDLTLFWLQTLPLFIFILSGIGTFENREEKRLFNLLIRQRYAE